MSKLFYTLAEVSRTLGETIDTIRYWEKSLDIEVQRTSGGRQIKQYQQRDIEKLQAAQYLIRTEGMTIEGAKAALRARHFNNNKHCALDKLAAVKQQLQTLLNEL